MRRHRPDVGAVILSLPARMTVVLIVRMIIWLKNVTIRWLIGRSGSQIELQRVKKPEPNDRAADTSHHRNFPTRQFMEIPSDRLTASSAWLCVGESRAHSHSGVGLCNAHGTDSFRQFCLTHDRFRCLGVCRPREMTHVPL